MRMVALSIMAVLATSSVGHSQEESTWGSGVMASKCSRLMEGIPDNASVGRHPLAFAMLSWTEGYITGANMNLPKGVARFDLNSLTPIELWASIYGFCKRNPDQLGMAAVIDTMSKLSRIGPEPQGQDWSEIEKEFKKLGE